MIKKINENQLRGIIRENVKKALKEGIGDEAVRGLFGGTPEERKRTFSEIDDAFQERGIDAYVSKFFSDENQIMIMVKGHENDGDIKGVMSEFGYGQYVGQGIDWLQFRKGEDSSVSKDGAAHLNNVNENKVTEKNKIKINEEQLRNIVAESVKRVLSEISDAPARRDKAGNGDFEFGTNPSNFEKGEYPGADAKGKNYFTKNGIVNCTWNDMEGESTRAWLTTTFLGHRHLALKLGARWSTALKKVFFNRYSVDEHCVLVVVEDKRSGLIALLQIGEDGIRMAYDKDDREVPREELDKLVRLQTVINGKSAFNWMFERTEKMCREEDEFFASKTSKTYERLRENKNKNKNKNKKAIKK